MQPVHYAFKGRAKVSLLRGGETVLEQPWTKNLLLDQGLDQMAETPICDIFLACAKGTGTEVTKETLPDAFTWTTGTTTVTRTVGTGRDFDVGDEGRTLYFTASGQEAKIATWIDSNNVTVDRVNSGATLTSVAADLYRTNQIGLDTEQDRTSDYSAITSEQGTATDGNVRTFKRTFIFGAEPTDEEVVTGTYSKNAFDITRVSGARDFTSGDVGKKIYFTSTGEEYVISGFSSATVVTVATSGTIAAQSIKLYGYTDYTEIGFSHDDTPGDNLNIRILLDTPLRAYGETGAAPGEQVKVTYEQSLTVEPDTVQPSESTYATFPINDPGNILSSNKEGRFAIENFLTSTIDSTGATSVDGALLDPAIPGYCALSLSYDIIKAITGPDTSNIPDRERGAVAKPFVAQAYSPGSFSRTYRANFTLNEAVAINWRSVLLYDPDAALSAFTFWFRHPQNKSGSHSVSFDLTKTWGRDLS